MDNERPEGAMPSMDEDRIGAIHEAAHAVVGIALGLEGIWVDIDLFRAYFSPPRALSGSGPLDDYAQAEARAHIAAAMAGRVGQELNCGGHTLPDGDAEDIRIALEIAARLAKSEADRQTLLEEGRRRAHEILTRPWATRALSDVVKVLLDARWEDGGIPGEAVQEIVTEAQWGASKG